MCVRESERISREQKSEKEEASACVSVCVSQAVCVDCYRSKSILIVPQDATVCVCVCVCDARLCVLLWAGVLCEAIVVGSEANNTTTESERVCVFVDMLLQ